MSVQSDVELMSIQALENYARHHHMSAKKTVDLFNKYQVFEKLLLQHEILHQLDFSDTDNYVEEIIEKKSDELIVYHGSNVVFDKIDLSMSHNRRDFGKGFYCTVLEKQSVEWAKRLYMRNFEGGKYVYQYIFTQNENIKVKRFATLDKEWLEFIKENRIKGGIQHDFDVVIGPVADDNTMETVQLYIAGILDADEAVKRLRYNKVNNQISFHTEKALRYLHFQCRKEV